MTVPSPTHAFAGLAREYCEWAESSPHPKDQELRSAIRFMAELYAGALRIPSETVGKDVEPVRVTDEHWKSVYRRFGALPFNYYPTFLGPDGTGRTEAPAVGDLADDLADIYRDLKAGLALWDAGHAAEAAWEWHVAFKNHWGAHAASALHALHLFAEEHP